MYIRCRLKNLKKPMAHIINLNDIYTFGDLHGRFGDVIFNIKKYDIKDSILIYCGDIGMGFCKKGYYDAIFKKINKLCRERNLYIFFIRGNHDDPSYFNSDLYKTGRVITVHDWSIIKTPNHNILCVGGAVSIDRKDRKMRMERETIRQNRYNNKSDIRKEYWEDEMPYIDKDVLYNLKDIDIVCTHTCPDFCYPHTKKGIENYLKGDLLLGRDIDNERNIMTNIYNTLKETNNPLKYWIYGHYHQHHIDIIDNIRFVLLDMHWDNVVDFYEIH